MHKSTAWPCPNNRNRVFVVVQLCACRVRDCLARASVFSSASPPPSLSVRCFTRRLVMAQAAVQAAISARRRVGRRGTVYEPPATSAAAKTSATSGSSRATGIIDEPPAATPAPYFCSAASPTPTSPRGTFHDHGCWWPWCVRGPAGASTTADCKTPAFAAGPTPAAAAANSTVCNSTFLSGADCNPRARIRGYDGGNTRSSSELRELGDTHRAGTTVRVRWSPCRGATSATRSAPASPGVVLRVTSGCSFSPPTAVLCEAVVESVTIHIMLNGSCLVVYM